MYFDAEIGFFYNYFRLYDPRTGKYPQNDPAGLGGGLNRSIFVSGNPLGASDPYGLYESPPLLRALVPGQAAYDNGRTAIENGNYGAAAVSFAAMLGEQVVTAMSFAVSQGARAVAATAEYCAATEAEDLWRASKIDTAKMQHIFSADHVKTGVMNLGNSKDAILNQARDALMAADRAGGLREGMNTVVTRMNGDDATVRAYIKNGEMQSMNLFKRISERAGQYVIDLR